MMMEASGRELEAKLEQFGIELPPEQIVLLDRYRELLWMWNERINLTRHTDYDKFVGRDVLDSVVLARFLEQGERVLDVGTGGGVPGVMLAIVRPDLKVSLCESVAKKARTVAAIVEQLGMPIEVAHARAEAMLERKRYDTLVARAVAPLAKLIGWLAPHWDDFDRLLVIKGRNWIEERRVARERGLMRGLELRRLLTYETPGTGGESVILQIEEKEAG